MFPFRTSSIFRSRYMALLWAAGIVWMALDMAGPAPSADAVPTDATGAAIDDQQVEQVAAILGRE